MNSSTPSFGTMAFAVAIFLLAVVGAVFLVSRFLNVC